MPDTTPRYFNFNDVSDDESFVDDGDNDVDDGDNDVDDGDNDVVDDLVEFEYEDEQEEEESDLIVDPYYFCVCE